MVVYGSLWLVVVGGGLLWFIMFDRRSLRFMTIMVVDGYLWFVEIDRG